jgi:SAM-dependent methyltransferase
MTDSVVPAAGDLAATGTAPAISYLLWTRLWDDFEQQVADLIRDSGAVAVGELGGGANPTLRLADLVGRPLEQTILDISADELGRTSSGVETLCVDLCAEEPPVQERFDVVFSRMLCEHVRSGRTFHRNCFAALRPGGYAVHFFPSITALPFALNRVLPSSLSRRVVESVFPARRRGGKHPAFPARYSWCIGPTPAQLDRFRSVGFEVVSCDAGVGHGYYDRFPPLRALERAKTRLVLKRPSPWLAAYVVVVLRRPA